MSMNYLICPIAMKKNMPLFAMDVNGMVRKRS